MIKIGCLIDTVSTDKAGTEKQLLQLIRKIDRTKFIPHLICLRDSTWLRSNSVLCQKHTLNYTGLMKPRIFKTAIELRDLVCQLDLDILQCFFNESILVAFLSKILSPRFPVLLSSRRDMGLKSDENWYHSTYRAILPFVNRAFDGVVVNSKRVRKWVCETEKLDPRKIKVIYNGVETCRGIKEVPPVFSDNKTDIWIGAVANLRRIKRIDLLIHSFQLLRRQTVGKRVKLLIIGDGPQRDSLVKLTHQLDITSDVLFVGRVSNVMAYLQNLDIGVLCSDREGLSNAILEYMACGLPVVATDAGGNSEIVDESNGFLVPCGDPDALAAALRMLVLSESLRKQKARKSIDKTKKYHTWDTVIPQWESYYLSLISKFGGL